MNIDPRVEPWLRALLDGVENSNHTAEVVATAAYAHEALVKALAAADEALEPLFADSGHHAPAAVPVVLEVRAALALAGETR